MVSCTHRNWQALSELVLVSKILIYSQCRPPPEFWLGFLYYERGSLLTEVYGNLCCDPTCSGDVLQKIASPVLEGPSDLSEDQKFFLLVFLFSVCLFFNRIQIHIFVAYLSLCFPFAFQSQIISIFRRNFIPYFVLFAAKQLHNSSCS